MTDPHRWDPPLEAVFKERRSPWWAQWHQESLQIGSNILSIPVTVLVMHSHSKIGNVALPPSGAAQSQVDQGGEIRFTQN